MARVLVSAFARQDVRDILSDLVIARIW